jgi:TolA-binding protein
VYQRIAFLLLFLCFGATAFGQFRATERLAFKNLSRQRWEKAKHLLDKGLQKDSLNAALKFIYTRYYFDPANPAYQVDSANVYLWQTNQDFNSASSKERERWRKGALDTIAMLVLRRSIDSAAFQHAKAINTEGAFLHFLSHYPDAEQREEASALRDEAAYLEAVRINTYQGFLAYLDKYPESQKASDARRTYDRLLFEARTSDRTLKSYEDFLRDYPSSPYRRIVERHIFEILTSAGDRSSLEQFLTTFPYSSMVHRACDILFHLSNELETPLHQSCRTDSLMAIQSLDRGLVVPVLQHSKYGFMNAAGKMLVQPQYDSILPDYRCGNIASDLLIADGLLISRQGKTIFPDRIISFEDLGFGFVKIETQACKRVIHKSGYLLGECIEDGKIIGKRFVAMKRNNAWGLFTLSGRVLTLFEWDDIEAHGDIIIFRLNGKYKLVTASQIAKSANSGQIKFSAFFDEVNPWSSEWLWAKSGNFQGVFNQQLSPVIVFEKHELEQTFFGALAKSTSGYKLYSRTGAELAGSRRALIHDPWIILGDDEEFQFFSASAGHHYGKNYDSVSFLGPFALAFKSDSATLLFNEIKSYSFPIAIKATFIPGKDSTAFIQISFDKRKTIYNQDGRKLFSMEYDNIQYAGNGFFVFTRKDKKGLVNSEGTIALQPEYDAIGSVTNNVVTYLKKMKFGAYHTVFKQALKPIFEKNLTVYNTSWLIAFEKGFFGFVDWKGKAVSKFEFDEVQYWNDSTALVKRKSDWFIYDIHLKKNVESDIKQIEVISETPEEKLCIIKQGDYFGVLSNVDGFIIPPSFTKLLNVGNAEEPLYFTEKHVEEALLFVMIYYDQNGKLLYRQVYEEEDYEKILCVE